MKNYLLLGMLISYFIPIYYVYYYYNCNNSVSNLICNEQYRNTILICMGLMGVFTILYEIDRNDFYSILMITVLLISIYGLLIFDETNKIHYLFAICVFAVILLFNIRHCYLTNCNNVLLISLFVSIGVLLNIVINSKSEIFAPEAMYIVNFAVFYLYLHFLRD